MKMIENRFIQCACGCGEWLEQYSHYGKKRKYINTHYARTLYKPLIETLFKKVKKDGDCFVWTGAKNDKGYGQIAHKGKIIYVHRYSYELFNGIKIPRGKIVLHSCDNPACIHPNHLILGNQCENLHDAMEKKRMNGNPVSDEDVGHLRKMYNSGGFTQKVLGKLFDTHQSNVSYIVNFKTRKGIPSADLR